MDIIFVEQPPLVILGVRPAGRGACHLLPYRLQRLVELLLAALDTGDVARLRRFRQRPGLRNHARRRLRRRRGDAFGTTECRFPIQSSFLTDATVTSGKRIAEQPPQTPPRAGAAPTVEASSRSWCARVSDATPLPGATVLHPSSSFRPSEASGGIPARSGTQASGSGVEIHPLRGLFAAPVGMTGTAYRRVCPYRSFSTLRVSSSVSCSRIASSG